MSDETRSISVSVEIPETISWEEIATIEDEMSESVGEILDEHDLTRINHERNVKAEYSE